MSVKWWMSERWSTTESGEHPPSAACIFDHTGRLIAYAWEDDVARFIAAEPQLLSACKATLQRMLALDDVHSRMPDEIARCKAAIAAAIGEQT